MLNIPLVSSWIKAIGNVDNVTFHSWWNHSSVYFTLISASSSVVVDTFVTIAIVQYPSESILPPFDVTINHYSITFNAYCHFSRTTVFPRDKRGWIVLSNTRGIESGRGIHRRSFITARGGPRNQKSTWRTLSSSGYIRSAGTPAACWLDGWLSWRQLVRSPDTRRALARPDQLWRSRSPKWIELPSFSPWNPATRTRENARAKDNSTSSILPISTRFGYLPNRVPLTQKRERELQRKRERERVHNYLLYISYPLTSYCPVYFF